MARRLWSRRTAYAIGALLVAVALVVLSGVGLQEGDFVVLPNVTDQQLADLHLGAARDDVERLVGGAGEDALEYHDTGSAVEPIDAECTYYTPETGFGVVQLCFRDDRLVSKRRYEPPPGFRGPGE